MPSDLVLKPDYVFETTPQHSTLISEFENGVEQRRNKWSQVRRAWRLVYKNRSLSDLNTILSRFDTSKGAYGSFTWDNPDTGVTYTVRFKDDSLTYSLKNYGIYDFEFELIQVL